MDVARDPASFLFLRGYQPLKQRAHLGRSLAHSRFERVVRLLQRLLGPAPLRHVERHSDHESPAVVQRPWRRGAEAPVPQVADARAHREVDAHGATGAGKQRVHVLAHEVGAGAVRTRQPGVECRHFLERVAGELGPGAADLQHLAVLGMHDHRDRRLLDGAPELLLACAQRVRRLLTFGHVAPEAGHAAVGGRIGAHVDPHLASVGPCVAMFERSGHPLAHDAPIKISERRMFRARERVPMRSADQLLARPAVQLHRLVIHVEDGEVGTEMRESLPHGIEDAAQALLALA